MREKANDCAETEEILKYPFTNLKYKCFTEHIIDPFQTLQTKAGFNRKLHSSTQKYVYFLFSHKNIACGYSLEMTHNGIYNK